MFPQSREQLNSLAIVLHSLKRYYLSKITVVCFSLWIVCGATALHTQNSRVIRKQTQLKTRVGGGGCVQQAHGRLQRTKTMERYWYSAAQTAVRGWGVWGGGYGGRDLNGAWAVSNT